MKAQLKKRGFTVLEILIVIAVAVLLASIPSSSFFSLNKREVLRGEAAQVSSVLAQARSLTLSAKDNTQYGVHLGTDEVVIFPGSSYSSGNSENQVIDLSPAVEISSVTLAGGGSNVIFDRLTGATDQSGTITISLVNDPSEEKDIVIYATGIVEIQ